MASAVLTAMPMYMYDPARRQSISLNPARNVLTVSVQFILANLGLSYPNLISHEHHPSHKKVHTIKM